MMMVNSVQRLMMVGNVSVLTLTRPKQILTQTRKKIYSKPARNKIGATQSFFVMLVFSAAMLIPAAWILHHLPEYRQRSREVMPSSSSPSS
ncbi:COX8 domain-containing protein [Scophthalmus maximus]|uniref:COX8 domain-containing protein n=1 Tax=Scophthalmus maximus TaxID=52904 RepID=UPI001FA93A41|nr:COX8 domain-containing protein [Scophthalmus maximus]